MGGGLSDKLTSKGGIRRRISTDIILPWFVCDLSIPLDDPLGHLEHIIWHDIHSSQESRNHLAVKSETSLSSVDGKRIELEARRTDDIDSSADVKRFCELTSSLTIYFPIAPLGTTRSFTLEPPQSFFSCPCILRGIVRSDTWSPQPRRYVTLHLTQGSMLI